MFRLMLDLLAGLGGKIADLDNEIDAAGVREDEVSRRLMTVPGIGPISATAIAALAPPAETFAKGRDFAAWLGLTPLQRSTGGKRKLGATSKMGERTLRRLLIIGSSAVVLQPSKRGELPPARFDRAVCAPGVAPAILKEEVAMKRYKLQREGRSR